MDNLTRKTLQELISHTNGSHISLLMPTHPAGKAKQQDPIRYKNLLKKAEAQCAERGIESDRINDLLRPARQLSRDPFFWEHQSSGLAVFSASGIFRSYRLPLSFDETVAVSSHFYLKPLLPYFANDGHFFILALSQKHLRLLEGTRHSVDQIDLEKIQPGLAETLRADQFFDAVQAHTGRKSPMSGEHRVMFHGHDPSDEEKKRVLGWFHAIDEQLNAFLKDQQSPLVLAGVDSIVRLFREACAYPHMVSAVVSGSPDEMRPGELHRQAWPLVAPVFQKEQQEALGRYGSLSGTDQAVSDLRSIVGAARHGRVDVLFLSAGEHAWGQVDPGTQAVHIHRDPEPDDRDLLDWAAVETLRHGGEVHVLGAADMPEGALIAAIFRY